MLTEIARAELAATDRVTFPGMAVAVGRFRPEGITGYRARTMPGAPLRATRVEAIADELRHLEQQNAATTGQRVA